MIPKIIHQLWVGANSMDADSLCCTKLTKELYESNGWTYMFHGNEKLNYYYNNAFSNYVKEFCKNNNIIYTEEIMKFLVLKEYGGFVSDTDNFPIRVVPDSLLTNSYVASKYPCFINNSFIGASVDNEIINYLSSMKNIEKNITDVLERYNILDGRITKDYYYDEEHKQARFGTVFDIMGPIYVSNVLIQNFSEKYYALPTIANFINVEFPVDYKLETLTDNIVSEIKEKYPDMLNIHFGNGNTLNGWIAQCTNETNLGNEILK